MREFRVERMKIVQSVNGSGIEHFYNMDGTYINSKWYDLFSEETTTNNYDIEDLTSQKVLEIRS
jgi:hypothetical protein